MSSQVEKELEIRRLAKRIFQLNQELELAGLDIRNYSVPLSKGEFPTQWAKDTNKAFYDYATEMNRIANVWTNLFKPEIETIEEVKPIIKTRKKRK